MTFCSRYAGFFYWNDMKLRVLFFLSGHVWIGLFGKKAHWKKTEEERQCIRAARKMHAYLREEQRRRNGIREHEERRKEKGREKVRIKLSLSTYRDGWMWHFIMTDCWDSSMARFDFDLFLTFETCKTISSQHLLSKFWELLLKIFDILRCSTFSLVKLKVLCFKFAGSLDLWLIWIMHD